MGWLDPTTLKFDVEKISKMRKDIEKTASEKNLVKFSIVNFNVNTPLPSLVKAYNKINNIGATMNSEIQAM